MPMQISEHVRRWLKTNGLEGYLRTEDLEPHPQVEEIMKEIDVDKITNKQMRRMKKEGYDEMDTLKADILQSYFSEYSPSLKAYETQGGDNLFFHDVVKFLLEVPCVSPHSYCMPK